MALLTSEKPSPSLLNMAVVLTNSLNTPSGQDTGDYFTAHQITGSGEPYTQASSRKDLPPTTLQPLTGSLLDLPNEILIHILELGYFEFDAPDNGFRSLASRISRKFYHLVCETPSLWSSIQLSFTNTPAELESLPISLKRSKAHPLALRLTCYWDTATTFAVMNNLTPYMNRWKHLTMAINSDIALDMLRNKPAPFLEYLSISYFGHRPIDIYNLGFSLRELETLEIRGNSKWPTYTHLNEMLGGSSKLKHLVVDVIPAQSLTRLFETQSWDTQIILPELQRLTISSPDLLSVKISRFIRIFACPKLEHMFLYASVSIPTHKPPTIMFYSRDGATLRNANSTQGSANNSVGHSTPGPMPDRFPNYLFLERCSLYAGCQALSGVSLTTLELQWAGWPTHSKLLDLFSSLQNLVNLFIFDLYPKSAVLSILGVEENEGPPQLSSDLSEIEGSIIIPHLKHLSIKFYYSSHGATAYYTRALFRIFTVPALISLHLKNIIGKEHWKAIIDISDHSPRYPALWKLTLTDMRDIVPTDPQDPDYADIVSAFPRLGHLSLDRFTSSNALLQQLLPSSTTATSSLTKSSGGEDIPFPDLQVLEICNDSFASWHLLHRIIDGRKKIGKPLRKVVLDKHFSTNQESLDWIEEHVEVVEVRGGV